MPAIMRRRRALRCAALVWALSSRFGPFIKWRERSMPSMAEPQCHSRCRLITVTVPAVGVDCRISKKREAENSGERNKTSDNSRLVELV
jgi:hypothetical protein